MNFNIDPCCHFKKYDLHSDDDLKEILFRDKHARIEGICTEVFFEEELLTKAGIDYSKNWWIVKHENKIIVIKFLVNINDINQLDISILDYFKKTKGFEPYILTFNETVKTFYYKEFDDEKNIESLKNLFEKNKKEYPVKDKFPQIPEKGSRNIKRFNHAISFLQEKNLLKSSALERIFANCYLKSSYLWDIDAFAFIDDMLHAFEVKQKYPTADGYFGLNTGLTNLFNEMIINNILVNHIILTKPVWDQSFPALIQYTNKKYSDSAIWIGTRFKKDTANEKQSGLAPDSTSIYTSSKLKYFKIEIDKFYKIKAVNENNDNSIMDFINGKSEPVKEIPRIK